ncbi:hypothetical protein ACS0TY_018230 [Phlomoides rotata]
MNPREHPPTLKFYLHSTTIAMSLPIVQVVFILFTFLSFSKPNLVISHTPNWLKETCNQDNVKYVVDPDLCLKILKSHKKIVSSTNQIDLLIAVIESGISNGTKTRTHVKNMLKRKKLDPNLKGALQECKSSYDSAIWSLNSALLEVKDGDYLTPSYDLLIASTDNIDRCANAAALEEIKDATILIGNKVLPMFGFIGFNVVNDLFDNQPPS